MLTGVIITFRRANVESILLQIANLESNTLFVHQRLYVILRVSIFADNSSLFNVLVSYTTNISKPHTMLLIKCINSLSLSKLFKMPSKASSHHIVLHGDSSENSYVTENTWRSWFRINILNILSLNSWNWCLQRL